MMRTPRTVKGNSFTYALIQGLVGAGITLLLFVFIVGFRADLNMNSQLELMPQLGLLVNYVLIVGMGRFVYVYCGGGGRGLVLALVPTSILFISYRAWLYYLEASARGVYDLLEQLRQLGLTFVALAVLFTIVLFLINSAKATPGWRQKFDGFKPSLQHYGPKLVCLLLLLYPLFVIASVDNLRETQKWIDSYAIQILIYIMLAWGLNIVVGFAGLLDLGYVAFYAVGSYTVALLGNHFGFSFWLCLPIAGILAAFWGILLGIPVLRLRGDYLAIVTLAFGEIIRIVLQNWTPVTGGASGLGVERATLFGLSFDRSAEEHGFAAFFGLNFNAAHYKIFLYYVIVVMVLVMAAILLRLRRLPINRAWEALREDEIACRSLGLNTVAVKLSAFATGALFGGFAGAFFAVRQARADYTSFVFIESVTILAIVVLGGMGSLAGTAIAAIVIIGGTELLREIPSLQMIFGPDFAPLEYRMLWFGLGMVLVMIWRPRGLVTGRRPSVFLKNNKAIAGHFTKEGRG